MAYLDVETCFTFYEPEYYFFSILKRFHSMIRQVMTAEFLYFLQHFYSSRMEGLPIFYSSSKEAN